VSKKRNFRCPECWRCYSNAAAVDRHRTKMDGRCIDIAPVYVADRIKHERAKIAVGDDK